MVWVAFSLVVAVVALPLLLQPTGKPPKPPPGPPKPTKTKQKTKQNNNKSLFSSNFRFPGIWRCPRGGFRHGEFDFEVKKPGFWPPEAKH